MSWRVQLHGYENLAPELRATYHEGLFVGMESLGIQGEEFVREKTPVGATQALLTSVQHQVSDEQAMIRLNIGVGPTLGADRYAAAVEAGAKPHFPPIQALMFWVKKKFATTDEKSTLSAAFAVAKTIAKRGMRPHNMFAEALPRLEQIAAPVLEKGIAQAFIRAGYTGGAA